MNFGTEKGRLTKKVQRTINDVQRPPHPLDAFDWGNFCGFVRTSDSILQRSMEINTRVLPPFHRQRSCAQMILENFAYFCAWVQPPSKYCWDFFGIGGRLFLTFPWIWCCVLHSRSHWSVCVWNFRLKLKKTLVLEIPFFLRFCLTFVCKMESFGRIFWENLYTKFKWFRVKFWTNLFQDSPFTRGHT